LPRSAFLEGVREARGTKTYSGAKVKQKTAVPQGAASLSLAVLESDGTKGQDIASCLSIASCVGGFAARNHQNRRHVPSNKVDRPPRDLPSGINEGLLISSHLLMTLS
jgi:hypothetical protein